MLPKSTTRFLLLLILLVLAMPLFAQEICEPTDDDGHNPALYPGPTTAVATRSSGGVGCDHGRMGIDIAEPPMPAAQLNCVRLEGPSYLGYRCVAHPRGSFLSYQWSSSTVSPYITIEPETDPGIAILTCNSPPNLWMSANVTVSVLGPLNQGSVKALDVDCTRYEPLNFP